MKQPPLTMQPLTPRMIECLAALVRLEAKRQMPASPNEIGFEAGHNDGGRRHGNGANRSTTGWQAPANRVNFALLGLEKRGLVVWTRRRDDLSGRAIDLTSAGARIAQTISQEEALAKVKATRAAEFADKRRFF